MNILYGVCGEGFGHASRSRILMRYLLSRNHTLCIVAGGKAYQLLSSEFSEVHKIESAHFVYKNNEVKLIQTCGKTLYQTLFRAPRSLLTVNRCIQQFQPDIVITDAEPLCLFASKFHRIPCVSIDNPHALLFRTYPVKSGEFFPWFLLIMALRMTMHGASKYLVYDFFDQPSSDERVVFLKPLIQEGIRRQKPCYGRHIFVYHTIGSNPAILETLKKTQETYIIYGMKKSGTEKNVVFKQFNEHDFFTDISTAKAVITSGGFTVISEALFLRKPIFCLPIKNQFEQMLNGFWVEQLGAGISTFSITEEKLAVFLGNLEQYQKHLKSYNPGDQEKTLQTIEQILISLVQKN
ncbi:MAG: glycosyltransferase family protein [Candidatus Thermoplasmatota archaeon]